MDINSAFPSNYLKASDLQGRTVDVVISSVTMEKVGDDQKPIVYFQGKEKGLALNKTNSNAIQMMYGDETNNWANQPISMWPTETEFQGKIVPCIRIKAPGGQDITGYISQRANQAPPPNNNPAPQNVAPGPDLDDEIPF